jgi:eukaryotic-like serine/threonine-protein kinase
MALAVGTRLNHYEVRGPLGAGGMGEVYRALDTRLDRAVAIKVLPADFAKDVDRLRRFEQEARATSALNHPNILTVYDIGRHEGSPYLVAELLEGEELRAQLAQGALPVRRAVDYAQQIAAGLAAAHEKGIVHRDLKPENLFITKEGRVKILDFGLAKLKPKTLSGGVDSQAPTLKPLTNPGVVMGTVGYMSPEQVRGQETDHRSDIFSFGLILHEMLSGQRTFTGDSLVEVMNAILKDEPADLSETNAKIPLALDKIVRRCLEKKPEQRFHSAHDLGFSLGTLTTPSGSRLETAMALPALTEGLPGGKAGWFGNARLWVAVAAAATLGLLLVLPFAVKYLRQAPPVEAVTGRFIIPVPEKTTRLRSAEISPDGRTLVFAAAVGNQNHLWARPLNSLTAQMLPGTEGVTNAHFWSPDSRSIGFPDRDGKLKRVELAGGAPQTICALTDPERGVPTGTWNQDGVILFSDNGRVYRVPATGGERVLVLGSDPSNQEALYRNPSFLPDGRHFLFTRVPREGAAEIHLAALDRQETTRLLAADSQVRYAASATGNGYLLFVRAGSLLAQPFDADSLQLTGESFIVTDRLTVSNTNRAMFSVSGNGTLVFDMTDDFNNQRLTWVDRTGKLLATVGTPGGIEAPRLSPDGKQVATVRIDPQTRTGDIYVTDLARGVSSRLTLDPGDERYPLWSPDGSHIAWQTNREGAVRIYRKLASGIGPEELLFKSDAPIIQGSWSPDGRYLICNRLDPKTKNDIWVVSLAGDRKPFMFLQTPFEERQGRLSPDGRWLAYESNDQGRYEISVQPFPASGSKWPISTNGGSHPRWRGDGKELYFISPDSKLMAVEIKPGNSFEAGKPTTLFDLNALQAVVSRYDPSADGQRFLFVTQGQETSQLHYTVVVNWEAEVKR